MILTHIKTLTGSGVNELDFVDGSSSVVLDSTYDEYMFVFTDINPATSGANFSFQVNATDDAGGAFDTSLITSTYLRAYTYEGGEGASALAYVNAADLSQDADFQMLGYSIDNDADSCIAGIFHLFSPSSTTYVKHFYSVSNHVGPDGSARYSTSAHMSGYINDTTAIDEIRFKMSTGAFDGVIQMYGVA